MFPHPTTHIPQPRHAREAGVTLLEMLVVVALLALMAGISFPTVSAGIDSLRLNSATDQIAAIFNEAVSRAERRQEPVEITISPSDRTIRVRGSDPKAERTLELAQFISIEAVLPPAEDAAGQRVFVVYPGGAAPRIGVQIANAHRVRRIVRLDPITGVPQIEQVP